MKDLLNSVVGAAFPLLAKAPYIKDRIKAEFSAQNKKLMSQLGKDDNAREQITVLPVDGLSSEAVLSKMKKIQEGEISKWDKGGVSGAVYLGDEAHCKCLNDVSGLFSLTNPLHPDIWPR